jgi:epsilon-lactone hydrolase
MITKHSLDPQDAITMAKLRPMLASTKGSVTGPSARAPFVELMEQTPPADGVTYEKMEVGGVPGWWCRPNSAPADAAILYFHGGAYVVGSARAYQDFVGQVAVQAGVSAFVPEYGLAPGYPFPAAVDDARAFLRDCLSKASEKSRWRVTPPEAASRFHFSAETRL